MAAFQRDRVKDGVKKLLRIFSSQKGVTETCAACGEKFVCGAAMAECWCSEVKLSEETRAKLKDRYKGCLCRACLERFAAEP